MRNKQTEETAFQITISKDGEFQVTDGKGKKLQKLDAEELGKTMVGREIRQAKSFTITYLHSNPGWVCIGGHWYYIP
jgi:ABC-type sugar transport system ATPase subunit